MSQGHRTLADRMLTRLQLATRWVTGEELAAGLTTSRVAAEDALGDLVAEGMAEYSADAGYRLNASQLCREAVRALQLEIRTSEQKNKFRRHVRCQAFENKCRVGVAEHRPREGQFMYELELDLPDDGGDINLRAAQLLAIANKSIQGEKSYG